MHLRAIRALGLVALVCVFALPLAAATNSGKISGVVVDSSGTPQMGATVLVWPEKLFADAPMQLLSNEHGRFSTATLISGSYSVKVTLAGFLPSMEQHIQVSDEHTTLLQIVLGSVFSSLDRLRRAPDQELPGDEWSWVLRSAAVTRPVLRWQDGDFVPDEQPGREARSPRAVHALLELTSGSDHPGSISNLADSPGTTFAYDMSIGPKAKLLMAGQVSYEAGSPAGGFVTEWIPSGRLGTGPVTSLVIRESQLGPGGPVFRGARLSHDGKLALGDRVSVRYGAEYVLAGFNGTASELLPRTEIAVRLSPGWLASFTAAARPWQDTGNSSELQSAMNALDAFPTLMLRQGRPVLGSDLHEEIALEHALSKTAGLTAAVFHDRSSHTAVFGLGGVGGQDYVQDYFSDVFAYDAGASSSMGVRVAYQQKLSENFDATVVYSYAGAVAPGPGSAEASLRDELETRYRQSLAGRVSTRLPLTHTKVTAGYKWISGPVVSHLDAFGESIYHLDPYLSMQLRQPLPSFLPWRMEAVADFGNLLAQGYVPITTGDGHVVLVPSYRYFRGGLAFQF